MVVGTLRFVLAIPGSGSLKAKRHVMRKVVDRVRARFNVAIAEVADNDLWQKASLGVAAVGNDRAFVNEVLDKVLRSVEDSGVEAYVVSHQIELLTFNERFGLGEERTLAEAEGLAPAIIDGDDEEYPSLEELEAAADRYHSSPPPAPGRRRRR